MVNTAIAFDQYVRSCECYSYFPGCIQDITVGCTMRRHCVIDRFVCMRLHGIQAMFQIKVGEQSVVYTGDYNMTPDRHLGKSVTRISKLALSLLSMFFLVLCVKRFA